MDLKQKTVSLYPAQITSIQQMANNITDGDFSRALRIILEKGWDKSQ